VIAKYIATLAAAVLALALVFSTLRFATRSQELSGKAVDETWKLEFTLDADRDHTYRVSPRLQSALEDGITFVTAGPVRVVSSSVEITPKDVSWTENRTLYTSPGAGLVAHVKWDTPADSANGAHGTIFIHFPEIPGLNGKGPTFHSGGYQRDGQGRYELREVTTYSSGILISLARFLFALAAALPLAIIAHCIFWGFQLKSEKRVRIAALPPQGSGLPRTFYSNPILEWISWTLWIGIAAFIGAIMAVFSVYDGFMSSSMVWFVYIALGVGAVIALTAAYFAGKSALTMRVEANGIAYAHGREDLQWLTAGWSDLLLSQKSRTYQGNRREWLELEFKDNRKKLKVTEDVEGYAALRDLLLSVFRPPATAEPVKAV
jgi:hypothetical protein